MLRDEEDGILGMICLFTGTTRRRAGITAVHGTNDAKTTLSFYGTGMTLPPYYLGVCTTSGQSLAFLQWPGKVSKHQIYRGTIFHQESPLDDLLNLLLAFPALNISPPDMA